MSDATVKSANNENAAIQIMPLVDILDSNEGLTLWFEIPGANSGTVSIEVKDDVLSLTANSVLRKGGRPVVFKRGFRLEEGIDPEKITAKTADGVLTLNVPKPEQARVHKIKVC